MNALRNAPFHSPAIVSSISLILLLGAGCGDSREVAELKTKIEAMATKQRELDSKLAAMDEKIVTKAIEVQGPIQAKSAEIDLIQAKQITASYSLRVSTKDSKDGHTLIYPWKIEINTLSQENQDGHISILDSTSLSISDYDGQDGILAGNGLAFSVKGARKVPSDSDGKENALEIWSAGAKETKSVRRNIWKEVPVKTEAVFSTDKLGQSVFYLADQSGGYGMFGAMITSITDDGIVRVQMANASPLAIAEVTGILEWSAATGRKAEVSFVIDRKMETGVWEPVSIPTGVPREQLFFLTIRSIQVRSVYFNRQAP